ncbi:LuxR family two component transcriptional regulator [Mycobacteroides abscessus subsp. abscessus]|nr:LuxR family two component transcriptional regulator [Mycobacteroides abscessus subsp. abscessus]
MDKKMWDVLIADDEPIIREGIRNSIDWSSLQMNVIAEAEDGDEAIELSLHSIDILLVDINMPMANGLQVIKQVKSKLPDCRIIIITGYDEFKYAQEAIRLNVSDYLLKPIDPDHLLDLLNKIKQELVNVNKQKDIMDRTSEQFTKNMPTLKHNFFREWLQGNLGNEEIKNQLALYYLDTSIPKQLIVISCLEFLENKSILSEKERLEMEESLKYHILLFFEDKEIGYYDDNSGLIILISWQEIAKNLIEQLEECIRKELNMTITVLTENNEGDYRDILLLYKRCKEIVQKEINISPIVRRSKSIIEHQYADSTLSLEKVALTLQVSPVYLSRLIKQELGLSFVQLLTNKRMKKAIYLLQSTDYPIISISELVGYESQHYFSTAFKKVLGLSPNKYRRNILDDTNNVKS